MYGSGSTTAVYEVYTTTFSFNNNSVSGGATGGGLTGGATGLGTGAFTTGAFANGNTILGIGVRVISGGSITGFTPTVRFDLDNDSYQAASSVGGLDGRTSFSTDSEQRDFTAQFEGASSFQVDSVSFPTIVVVHPPSNFSQLSKDTVVGTSQSGEHSFLFTPRARLNQPSRGPRVIQRRSRRAQR